MALRTPERLIFPAMWSAIRTATRSRRGRVPSYRALGLRNRADYIPVTDSNTLSDAAQYNLPSNNPAVIPAREGRTMGQAVLDLLSMQQNMTALSAAGIGNYTSAGYGGVGTAVLSGTESGSSPWGYSVASITVSQPGSGYTTAPNVVLAGGGGSVLTAICTVEQWSDHRLHGHGRGQRLHDCTNRRYLDVADNHSQRPGQPHGDPTIPDQLRR